MNLKLKIRSRTDRLLFGALIALLLFLGIPPSRGFAEPLTIPPIESFVLSGRGVGYSAPAVAELDGNVSNGSEIVLGGVDGKLYALKADGTELWSINLPGADCPNSPQKDKLYSSPAIGALRGDGVPYVVIGYGGFKSAECDGGIAAYRASDGTQFWNFSLKDFAGEKGHFAYRTMVFSKPALADVNGDGTLEIGFGAFDRHVYLLNSDGSLRWYYHAADTVWSSPLFANVDSDPNLEMIIGTDITRNSALNPPTQDGGFLYAFDTHAVMGGLVPFRDPQKKITKWRRYFDQVVYSSPVIGEVLPSKRGSEIVIGSGCFFPSRSLPRRGNEYRVLSLRTGKVLKKIPTPLCSASSAAIGDINGDGLPDVVLAIDADKANGGDGKGTVMAVTPETGAVLWSVSTRAIFPFQSPVLADLGGDGALEVVVSEATSLAILNGATGAVVSRIRLPGTVQSTAAVVDLDGSGRTDIVAAGGKGGDGALYVLRNFMPAE